MGSPDFAPTVRGMGAVLPYIDPLARQRDRVQRGAGLGWRRPKPRAESAAPPGPKRRPLPDTVKGAARKEGAK